MSVTLWRLLCICGPSVFDFFFLLVCDVCRWLLEFGNRHKLRLFRDVGLLEIFVLLATLWRHSGLIVIHIDFAFT